MRQHSWSFNYLTPGSSQLFGEIGFDDDVSPDTADEIIKEGGGASVRRCSAPLNRGFLGHCSNREDKQAGS